MECGGQCVMMDGAAVMPELCADNWGSLDQVINFALSKCSLPPINSMILMFFLGPTALYGFQHNFGQGTGPVFLYRMKCSGTESSLLRCSHSGIRFNWCGHYADAGVVCPCTLHVYSFLLPYGW